MGMERGGKGLPADPLRGRENSCFFATTISRNHLSPTPIIKSHALS